MRYGVSREAYSTIREYRLGCQTKVTVGFINVNSPNTVYEYCTCVKKNFCLLTFYLWIISFLEGVKSLEKGYKIFIFGFANVF